MYAMLMTLWLTLARVAPKKLPRRRPTFRPRLETLEDRALPSAYSAANVSQLIGDINAANAAGGSNTITLTAPTTSPYVLTSVNNTTDGANGLPVIAANDNLTIVGNGDTIERSTAAGTAAFRLFDVADGASLMLQNLTLEGGLASSTGVAQGGAIYNQGTLTLSGVTVQGNTAQGLNAGNEPGNGAGGGIWSSGSLTLENGTLLEGNASYGSPGYSGIDSDILPGNAYGGAVYVAGGSVNSTNTTFTANSAGADSAAFEYADKSFGGALYVAAGSQVVLTTTTVSNNSAAQASASYGGGLYVAGGTVTLTNDIVESNGAGEKGGLGGDGGGLYVYGGTVTLTNDTVESNTAYYGITLGYGGGLYVGGGHPPPKVYIDAFTLANAINNTATVDPNIDGTYSET